MLLLDPGPVTLTERVRRSLLQIDLCHRESEFFDVQEEARTRLVDVYGLDAAQWQAVLMTGFGTAAVESIISSLARSLARSLAHARRDHPSRDHDGVPQRSVRARRGVSRA